MNSGVLSKSWGPYQGVPTWFITEYANNLRHGEFKRITHELNKRIRAVYSVSFEVFNLEELISTTYRVRIPAMTGFAADQFVTNNYESLINSGGCEIVNRQLHATRPSTVFSIVKSR